MPKNGQETDNFFRKPSVKSAKLELRALRQLHWHKPVSALEPFRDALEESFRKNPPRTVAEACARIKAETGVDRKPSQVRAFLKKCWA